ncbi:MAG: redoxin domain-containing protein [Verrucomicrobiota bacterium]|nr:redoxin domain-containing protein [Verrucomicrobiota bacterium]
MLRPVKTAMLARQFRNIELKGIVMRNRILSPLLLATVLCGTGYALDVGDKAPTLKVAKWLVGRGADPTAPASNQVCVVEIWATWCPPCRISIPHLNQVHAKLKDKGVVIMSISGEPAETVETFLKTMPMNYYVGIDDNQATCKAYNFSDGGVPRAFVVGKDAKIAWRGHPLDGLDRVLAKMTAGTFDAKAAVQAAQLEKELQVAAQLGNAEEIKAVLDKLLKLEPDNPKHHVLKVALLSQGEELDIEGVKASFAAWAKGCAEYDTGLRMLVSTMLDQDYDVRDPELIMSCATKAMAMGAGDPEIAIMMSKVHAEFGQLDQAIELLRKTRETADPQTRKRIAARLDYYTKAKRLVK